jgi:hypothetical protein
LEGTFKLKSAMATLIENINIQNVPEKRKYPKDNPAALKKKPNEMMLEKTRQNHLKGKLTLVVNL